MGSKITADSDPKYEIKRCLLLGRKAMTNLDSVLKSRGITLATSSVQFSCSVVSDSATPWTAAPQASLSINNSRSLLTECPLSLWCHPTISSSVDPSSFNLSQHQGLFKWVSSYHQWWPEYWSFSFGISPSIEYWGLIAFRIDWLYLLVVQGILKSLLQHHSSKASIVLCLSFFIFQLSHPYMTIGKIA